MSLPLIIQKDGTVFFYKNLVDTEDAIAISKFLKRTTIQIQYTDKFEIYKIEDYSIMSLILANNDAVNEFIRFIQEYSYNEFPLYLSEHIKNIQENIKVVSLTLGKTEIIIRAMRGDLSFLSKNKKNKGKVNYNTKGNFYTYPRKENYKLIEYLADKNVNMVFPAIDVNEEVSFQFKENITLRYYQQQAFEALINRKKGLTVMPSGSGKTYIAIKLIQYFKKVTLILCENKTNCLRWKDMILRYLNINNQDISVHLEESDVTKINKINIYSYDIIRSNVGESIIQELVDSKWGVIIYDNAHKAVTPKTVDLLYLKSNYKFAFDSTLNRSDGRERSLLNLFGGITYNISSDELINNLYQKKLECYQADLRKLKITKEEFTRCLLYKMDTKSVVIVTHQINEMERISKVLGIENINRFTKDEKRIELIKNFNDGKMKQLCIGNLVEKYPITNIDVMIATGYRGGTEIEDDFRIGALCSTPSKLPKVTVVKIFYFIKNDTEDRNVRSKEQYLHKYGIKLKDIDIKSYIGDDNS